MRPYRPSLGIPRNSRNFTHVCRRRVQSWKSSGRGAWHRKVDRTSSILERHRPFGTLCRWQIRSLDLDNQLTITGIRMGQLLGSTSSLVSRLDLCSGRQSILTHSRTLVFPNVSFLHAQLPSLMTKILVFPKARRPCCPRRSRQPHQMGELRCAPPTFPPPASSPDAVPRTTLQICSTPRRYPPPSQTHVLKPAQRSAFLLA